MVKKSTKKRQTKIDTKSASKSKPKRSSNGDVRKLYRSKEDKVIAGVCGGVGEHFNIDPVWVRLVAILLLLADGIGLILYIIAWVLIPENPLQKKGKKNEFEKQISSFEKVAKKKSNRQGMTIIGFILVGAGIFEIARRYISWIDFSLVWPLLIIGVGVYLLKRGK